MVDHGRTRNRLHWVWPLLLLSQEVRKVRILVETISEVAESGHKRASFCHGTAPGEHRQVTEAGLISGGPQQHEGRLDGRLKGRQA